MFWKPTTTPEDVLCHSAKGSHWKKHKYIRIEGERYIYDSKDGSVKEQKR